MRNYCCTYYNPLSNLYMVNIEAFKTRDGCIFENAKAALDHENDLIGQELDSLFDIFKLKSGSNSIGHQAIYYASLSAIADKDNLKKVCAEIVRIIEN